MPPPALAQVSAESWARAGLAPFDQSPPVLAIQQGILSARESVRESLAESQFTLETRLSGTGFQPNPDSDELLLFRRRFLSLTASGGVRYHSRLGLDIALRGDATQDRYQEPAFKKVDLPYVIGLDVSYDVLTGGPHGRERTAAAINAQRAWASYFTGYQRLLELRIEYQRLLTDLFANACKIVRLQTIKGEVGKTVLEGKIQVQAKTISYKDYLNFLDLENSFGRRLIALQSQQRSLTELLSTWGPTVHAALPPLADVECPADLDASLSRARAVVVGRPQRGAAARSFPSYAAAQAALEQAQLALRLAQLTQAIGLVPFVSGEFSRQVFSRQSLGSVTAGLAFQWNIPGARGRHETAAASAAHQSAITSLTATGLRNLATLGTLSAEVESQEHAWVVQKKSLETSKELLKTLVAQRAIGMVDSLSYTSAYLNSVETWFSLVDSWAQLEKTTFALQTYQSWVEADAAAEHD